MSVFEWIVIGSLPIFLFFLFWIVCRLMDLDNHPQHKYQREMVEKLGLIEEHMKYINYEYQKEMVKILKNIDDGLAVNMIAWSDDRNRRS